MFFSTFKEEKSAKLSKVTLDVKRINRTRGGIKGSTKFSQKLSTCIYFTEKIFKIPRGYLFVVVGVKLNFNVMLCDYKLLYSRPSRFERNFVQVAEADQNSGDVTHRL